jgi:hypothetical protein
LAGWPLKSDKAFGEGHNFKKSEPEQDVKFYLRRALILEQEQFPPVKAMDHGTRGDR